MRQKTLNGFTLSQDGFPTREFDFMLSNPPYGKSWKTDLDRMGGKADIKILALLLNMPEIRSLVFLLGQVMQLMFLANKLCKMNMIQSSEVGSLRFTTVRRSLREMRGRVRVTYADGLLKRLAGSDNRAPLNIFTTRVSRPIFGCLQIANPKRKGKVQLIDASAWFKPLRKNLGKKNCELSEDDIKKIAIISFF